MRPPEPARARAGFSLVELLVAMMFMALLMAGLATVFKASLGSYMTAAESTSSGRQNNLSLQMLYDDLNNTGMTPSALYQPPVAYNPTNQAFQITPNVAYAGTDAIAPDGSGLTGPVTDQLILYFDYFMPYTVTVNNPLQSTSQAVAAGSSLGGGMNSFSLSFNTGEATLAANDFTNAVTAGFQPVILIQATGTCANISSLSSTGAITLSNVLSSTNTGTFGNAAPNGSGVNLIIPGVYVMYQIQGVALDPSNTTYKTPCLVRTEIAYPGGGAAAWTSPYTTTIIADNVTEFHVGLSADGGTTWTNSKAVTASAPNGWNYATTGWSDETGALAGATSPQLNAQLAGLNSVAESVDPAGAAGSGGPFWFRQYPVLVRMDITTRTSHARTEYFNANSKTFSHYYADVPRGADYKFQTRTLILNPRHFGLHY